MVRCEASGLGVAEMLRHLLGDLCDDSSRRKE